jgi:hypothetical protein
MKELHLGAQSLQGNHHNINGIYRLDDCRRIVCAKTAATLAIPETIKKADILEEAV